MRSRKLDALIMGLVALTSLSAYADTTTSGVSTANAGSLMDVLSEKVALSYFGIFRGGPISNVSNSYQPKVNGELDMSSPISFENLVYAGYKFDKDTMLGVVGHFMYYPVGAPVGTGADMQMLDPSLIVQKKNMIKVGNFSMQGRFLITPALTSADYLKPNNLSAYVSPTLIFDYSVPKTDLSLGAFTYLRAYVPNSEAADNVRTYKIYAAPYANYQLTKTLAATMWVDLVQASRYGGTNFFNMANDPIDIEPGLNWDITKNLSINPILNIYPSNPTLAATSLQAYIVAKAF